MSRTQVTCNCPVYNFPHRQGGGKCQQPDWCSVTDENICTDDEDNECPFHDECPFLDGVRLYVYEQHMKNHPSLTISERNPGLR